MTVTVSSAVGSEKTVFNAILNKHNIYFIFKCY